MTKDRELSVAGIADALGVHRTTVHGWEAGRATNGFPKRTKSRRLNLRLVQQWCRDREKDAITGDGSWLDEIRKRQVKKLDFELDQMERELVPRQEVVDLLLELAAGVNSVFDVWMTEVGALTGDVKLVEEAERLSNRMRSKLREKVRVHNEK